MTPEPGGPILHAFNSPGYDEKGEGMAFDDYPYSVQDEPESFSRRNLLKQGTAAVLGGGAAAILGTPLAQAQAPAPPPAQDRKSVV